MVDHLLLEYLCECECQSFFGQIWFTEYPSIYCSTMSSKFYSSQKPREQSDTSSLYSEASLWFIQCLSHLHPFFYPEISNEDCRHIYIHPTHQLKASQDNTEDKITNFFFTMMSCLCVCALALIIVMREGPFCAVQNWPYDLWSSSKRHVKYVAYCFYWQGKPAYLLLL